VGAFAVDEGYVDPTEPVTTVRVYNTNLDCVLTLDVPVRGRRALELGEYRVPGVPGTGARILVDLAGTAGKASGALLPTGHPVDRLQAPGGDIDASLVDIGNAHVFVRARDVGLTGTETAAEIDANHDLRSRLEAIRGAAAVRFRFASDPARAAEESPATPLLGLVSPPADYWNEIGQVTVAAGESDVVSRLMFMQQMHKAYAGTSTVCTGVASRLPGTVVHEMTRPEARASATVRIGHPGGVIETEACVDRVGADYVVRRATLGRTARRILEGYVHVPDRLIP
jgi:2-methylaconitate cis-trans-isomerase PrpF